MRWLSLACQFKSESSCSQVLSHTAKAAGERQRLPDGFEWVRGGGRLGRWLAPQPSWPARLRAAGFRWRGRDMEFPWDVGSGPRKEAKSSLGACGGFDGPANFFRGWRKRGGAVIRLGRLGLRQFFDPLWLLLAFWAWLGRGGSGYETNIWTRQGSDLCRENQRSAEGITYSQTCTSSL
jgi:hypothetical protein